MARSRGKRGERGTVRAAAGAQLPAPVGRAHRVHRRRFAGLRCARVRRDRTRRVGDRPRPGHRELLVAERDLPAHRWRLGRPAPTSRGDDRGGPRSCDGPAHARGRHPHRQRVRAAVHSHGVRLGASTAFFQPASTGLSQGGQRGPAPEANAMLNLSQSTAQLFACRVRPARGCSSALAGSSPSTPSRSSSAPPRSCR